MTLNSGAARSDTYTMRPLRQPLPLLDATDARSPAVRLPCGAVVRLYPGQMAALKADTIRYTFLDDPAKVG